MTLSNGVSIYATGDTSTTDQMAALAERHIDYAFFVCDPTHGRGCSSTGNGRSSTQAPAN